MKKGLFTKTVLATFISMTLVSTASAEFMYRAPVEGVKASASQGSESGGEEETAKSAWEQWAEDNDYTVGTVLAPNETISQTIRDLPSEPYPVQENVSIYLEDSSVKTAQGFSNITSASYIDLSRTDIDSVDMFSGLQSVNMLYLRDTSSLNSLSGMSSLTNAGQIYLQNSGITTIGTTNLEDVGYLYLDGSAVKDLNGLESLKTINFLNINNNADLMDISALRNIESANSLFIIIPEENTSSPEFVGIPSSATICQPDFASKFPSPQHQETLCE